MTSKISIISSQVPPARDGSCDGKKDAFARNATTVPFYSDPADSLSGSSVALMSTQNNGQRKGCLVFIALASLVTLLAVSILTWFFVTERFNECESSPCQFNSTCYDHWYGFSCSCNPGFEGLNCEVEVDECQSNPCQNNGTCIDGLSRYECICLSGYASRNCEDRYSDVYSCSDEPCMNRGVCEVTPDGYICHCLPGFGGTHCEVYDRDADDIIFIIDTSGSVDEFKSEIENFCDYIVLGLDLGTTSSKIALVTFGTTVVPEWGLSSSTAVSESELLDGFSAIEYDGSGAANPYDAFVVAYNMLLYQNRPEAPNYMILISDGSVSSEGHEWVNEVVERAARVLIVGTDADAMSNLEMFNSYEEDRFDLTQAQDVIDIIEA